MNRIRVRRCNRKSWRPNQNWRIEQPVEDGRTTRVFIYNSHQWAMLNADRLARGRRIGTYGLRGFQIEYPESLQITWDPTVPFAL